VGRRTQASERGIGSGGAAGTGGTSSDGSAGTGGTGGDGTAVGTLGQPCSPNGSHACAGHAQREQLVCAGNSWAGNGTCAAGNNCDTAPGPSAGSCEPVVTECSGKSFGDVVCRGLDRLACGLDLVTTTAMDTCAAGTTCTSGSCVPPLPGCLKAGYSIPYSGQICTQSQANGGPGCTTQPPTCNSVNGTASVALSFDVNLGWQVSIAGMPGGPGASGGPFPLLSSPLLPRWRLDRQEQRGPRLLGVCRVQGGLRDRHSFDLQHDTGIPTDDVLLLASPNVQRAGRVRRRHGHVRRVGARRDAMLRQRRADL
jgi:hypothetical protein